MKLSLASLGLLLLLAFGAPQFARAQVGTNVVTGYACPSGTNVVAVGNNRPLIMTQDGALCVKGVYALAPYASAQTPVSAASGNVANAPASASMAAVVAKTNYVCGVEFTASGATAASVVSPTITGLSGGTVTYTFAAPVGVSVEATPLLLQFTPCLSASAVNTAITATLPALGSGNTNATVSIHGFYQ